MELRNSSIQALIFIILLSPAHHTDCRYNINYQNISAINSGMEELPNSSSSSKKVGPIHSVAHQIVPAGCGCSRVLVEHDETEERLRTKFLTTFARHFGVIPEHANVEKDKDMKAINVVSRRLVPAGPNPLHN
ncbi:hypothetical protein ACH5RR_017092 [Cinchona calisaya]|uniref:Uncharacterized protein n=1 Tax=Cinchona calisaya TaxID=153742 RepID=A0ABD2ZZ31_9GENT